MLQNSSVSAMLLNPKILDVSQKSMTRDVGKSNDTFMNMLNERMQARQGTDIKNRPMEKAGKLQIADKRVDDAGNTVEKKDPESTKVDSKDTQVKEKTQVKSSQKNETKTASEDTIMTLEQMVALLEELLARLDVKTVSAEPLEERTAELMPIESGSPNVNPMELLKALLEGNAEKLKALMGAMGQTQKAPEMNELLEKIQELLNKLNGEQKGTGSVNLDLKVQSEGMSSEELMNQLKAQCSGVIDKLKKRISELKNAEPQELEVENGLAESVKNTSGNTQLGDQTQPDTTKVESASETKQEPRTDSKASDSKEKHLQDVSKPHEQAAGKEAAQDKSASNDFSIPADLKPQDTSNVKLEKTAFPLTEKPLAQTVTNQVMMKVKLMTGENKQEMEMHLKPESLGKLSLKIIHERGEILAKITAENEQVKGILESNMQLLKDALEKSGLQVQSLSVSVGNGKEKEQARQDLNENGRTGIRNLSASQKTASTVEALNTRSRIRDYYEQDSKINLTA